MAATQAERGERFRALHRRPGAFVIPNPWDAGTARMLESLGFEALATTSAGLAFTHGRRDGEMTREETLANAKAIADATDLPVAADLENGFGDAPEDAAETIRLAGESAESVGKPVNVVIGIKGMAMSIDALAALGVRRISLGSSLSRAALGAFLEAAREIREHGTFSYISDALPSPEANAFFA